MKKGKTGGGDTSHIVSTTEIETQKGMPAVCTLEQQQLGTGSAASEGSEGLCRGSALRRCCHADRPVNSDWVSVNRSHRRSSSHRAPLSLLTAWPGLERARPPEDEVISRELRGEQVEETQAWMRQ